MFLTMMKGGYGANIRYSVIGLWTALLACAVMIGISSVAIMNTAVSEEHIDLIVGIMLFLSALTGGVLTGKLSKNRKTAIVLNTLGLMLVIVCGAMLIDGPLENIWINLCSLLAGSSISCVLCRKRHGWRKRMKYNYS